MTHPVAAAPPMGLQHSYAQELPGMSVAWPPQAVAAPRLLWFNAPLAEELGLDPVTWSGPTGAAAFAGNALPADAQPLAQVYAGHQFGGFSPQLGDGRALLLGERIDRAGRLRDIALKGSGRTPFSRGGDGRAAVGPMLREALISEAMHALGIPTTRSLAVVATGDKVRREQALPGAILTRIAASHLRVGTFQFFASRGETAQLRRLADYAITRHDPALIDAADRYLQFLRAVALRQARLIAQWMNVGFIHGVMNTDNMTISGETIDYGPCAFMEAYDPATVFSSIDHAGRYAYANQPHIARWNLARLAETLLPLIATSDDEAAMEHAVEQATEVIDAFPGWYDEAMREGQRAKLGLRTHEEGDAALADDWLALLHIQKADFTLAWRSLGDAAAGEQTSLRTLLPQAATLDPWLQRWRERCARDDASDAASRATFAGSFGKEAADAPAGVSAAAARRTRMHRANPFVIARNHRVEEALSAASDHDDLQPFRALLAAVQTPFDESPQTKLYAEPASPQLTERYRTFCGT